MSDWRERANCRGIDPDLFFPGRNDANGVRQAKAVCAGCTVRQPCLDAALERNEKRGIWGGLSEKQRRALRRQREAS